ncbi:siderophore ABC transporter substrate-binding protein [Peribacillus cavernae]|uniref:Siderophore ABC transporter substrate-binding protein n=1 Tax=Peribacillus cavernae TaxID=1674310 RepID=A0A433HC89_9BACI|nr:siderophore ABC transporter substrate-binding protein [Peribacillus cavernae]MDQ0219703.1 iron complex transport system substrate-binding protein [Peribacillus cavernae]RUQ25981.1 siderophore ABC transporter substrate-binding protein [Peribacillus cavernae]
MIRKLSLFLLISILAVVVAACGSNDSAESKSGSEGKKESEEITIKHQLGETKVKKNPEKVVVFDFGTLDTLDKLGVKVTGVPGQNLPKYLDKYKSVENVGGLTEPDFEKINELQPDLIIISGRQQDAYDKFNEIAPTIFMGVDTKRYMESFKENVTTLGDIFSKEDQAKQELAKIDDSIASLKEKASANDGKALITLTSGGKVTAYGPSSRFGLIHDVFGIKPAAENLEADPVHGQNISFEFIAEQNPDILYVIDRDAAVGEGNNAKKVIENDLVKKTKAYKNGKIVYLDPDYWYLSGGGLVSVVEMVNEAETGIK